METLYPSSYAFNSNWLMQECQATIWTKEENKRFESALAVFDKETPDRWMKIATLIPGKSVLDVMEQYKELLADISDIEAGLVPLPGYLQASSFSSELVKNRTFNEFRKRPLSCQSSDQEKKKGVPWTEDEHRRFLMGLQKYGKGDWRNISRNFVITKTSIQVASHAQKYYLRQQLSEGKEKRRPSIHDITTVNLNDATKLPSDDKQTEEKSITSPKKLLYWNHLAERSVMALNPIHSNPFIAYANEIASNGLNLQKGMDHRAHIRLQNLGF